MNYELEEITFDNVEKAYEIDRSDIPEDFVDGVPNLIENLEYGRDHNCIGHAFLIKQDGRTIGTILLGEGIVWDAERFYKRHGFTKTEYMEGNDYYYIRGL